MPFSRSRSLLRPGMLLSLLAAATMVQAQQAQAQRAQAQQAQSGRQARPADDAELGSIVVVGKVKTDKTEQSNSYTTSVMSTTTGLELSQRETPQSVSVVTRKQLKDRGVSRLSDALRNTTGINVVEDSSHARFQSRGF